MKVRLLGTKLLWSSTRAGECQGVIIYIDVEDLGNEKDVQVHFADGSEERANYEQSLPNNRELWVCRSDRNAVEDALSFCIKYTVSGKAYWEHDGMKVRLQNARLNWSSSTVGWCNGVTVLIDVENLGYGKEVLVHFDDGREERASYVQSLPDNRELWVWESPRFGSGSYCGKGSHRLKFCVKYVINGETYWDNNAGWDYCLTDREDIAPAIWKWPSSFN